MAFNRAQVRTIGLAALAGLLLLKPSAYGASNSSAGNTTPVERPLQASNASACGSGNQYTFVNNNSYPVWLAEFYQGSGDLASNVIAPPGNSWKLASNQSVSLCMPVGWSGRFWPRTECKFDALFQNDPGFTTSCTSSSDCSSFPGTVCFGGRCMIQCSSGSAGNSFCQGASGLNNENALCVTEGGQSFCSYASGTVCATGDCGFGLYQCQGVWDGNGFGITGDAPASLFEATIVSASGVNFDVSLVSGYNTAISAVPSATSCYAPSCVSDLNASCPANLQVTEQPSAAGTIPCGAGTFCQSGFCSSNICVIGCNDPGDQCSGSPPVGLSCNTKIPNGDGSTYFDMYEAANKSGNVDPNNIGAAMSSGNQGTPTCWSNVDCLPGETCQMSLIPSFPNGLGICSANTGLAFQPQPNCSATTVGQPCGGYYGAGYPNAQGYVCESVQLDSNTDYVCVPQFNPPTNGIGTAQTPSGGGTTLYTGVACPINPEWLTAATSAGNGTPWYESFSNACPHQYGWTYDDHAGDIGCTPGGSNATSMTVAFGVAASDFANVPGPVANDIGVAANGTVWITTPAGQIYRYNGTSFQPIPGNASRVAVGPHGNAWVVNSGGLIYRYTGSNFVPVPGPVASDIGVGANGTVWITTTGGLIYRYNGTSFKQRPGNNASRIAVGPRGNAWVVNSAGLIYRYNGSKFVPIPGIASDIGVGADGVAWITTPGGGISRYSGTGFSPVPGPAGARQISVDQTGRAWVVTAAGSIYQYSP